MKRKLLSLPVISCACLARYVRRPSIISPIINRKFLKPERITLSTVLSSRGAKQQDIVYPSKGEVNEEREEFVFRVQGYLLKVNLPPIIRVEQYVLLSL